MINKKIASEIAVGIILLLVIVIGGIFWLQPTEDLSVIFRNQAQIINNKESIIQPPIEDFGPMCTQEAKQCDDGSYVSRTGPKCEFTPCPVSQAVKNGYKIVEIKNALAQFSFEIPEKWLTETRNSGEKQLTTEEMRDFLATNYDGDIKTNSKLYSDYTDLPWSEIKKMNTEEVEDAYFRKDLPYANASVSAGDYIWYTDTSGQQIDFYVLKNFESLKTYYNELMGSKNSKDKNKSWLTEGSKWLNVSLGGFDGEVVTFGVDINESGNESITKGGTGGKIYFFKINNGKDMFIIHKQAKGDEQFEKDFEHLIQTLKIKAL